MTGRDPEPYRASGDCLCPICGRKYLSHPLDWKYLDQQGEPYLNRLCGGDLVKL